VYPGGFKHNRRSQKRLKDIAPDDVDVQSAPSSDAEDNDVVMSPSKRGRRKVEKGKSKKKRDGWIWLESLMRGQGQSDEKLAAYKKESKWQCISI
jgi:hypothetical protein